MINGFKVITLCGSTRFKDEFLEAQKRLTLEGNIVISVGLFGHSGDDVVWTDGVKDMLDRQHLAKIDLADEIYVINVGGYIGDSTRREIAYADYRGKSITYLESCIKPSLYDNYDALGELYDAKRISDEDFEQAERDFDKKRDAAIAEYNAYQGPWPYQWKNIDAVVCGVLQQHGPVSIDYHDIKDLYDADCVYEVRIKGKGANDEEQIQSIIDTIKSEYLVQLRSSKKIVVTLCGSSDSSKLLEKLADCMDTLNVVWQTRCPHAEVEGIEISIVFVMESELQTELRKWSKETASSYLEEVKRVGESVATSFYNQSDLSRVKKCELMIIGINPGAGCPFSQWDLKNKIGPDFLYKGNPCFEGKTNKVIIREMSEDYYPDKRRYGWDLWKKIHKLLDYSGKGDILYHLDRFVLTNMVFFGTASEGEIPKEINKTLCAKQTVRLIDLLTPKLILLLGDQCKTLFEDANNTKMIEIEARNLSYCRLGNSYVFAIKHTAHFYSNVKCEEISKTICYALDNPDKFEGKFKLVQLKHKVGSNGSIQWINSEGELVHEYFCKGINGKYERGNGIIAVGLKIDNEGNKYVLSVLSEGNHPDKFKKMLCDYCEKNKWSKSSNDLSYTVGISTSEDVIVDFMSSLLEEMKTYREKDLKE